MTGDARQHLPREPYPGLRPFLGFEAALLFGRERQVREVIDRLQQTQFVAVLGGSGSGKSSLIHAGVTPELRSFGIPGAGDLWLPLVCTPGTNVSEADRAARQHTPITRLARRFAALLRSRGSPEADAQRVVQIAEVFRQEAGFARLLDTFGDELAVPPGPDPAEARVLFVLDQFEEIFHPTNQGVEDARLLVERVLDHFFAPHPRCYVVLTMRSEHLNDCAAYLELPDAINKSSYLVRRLDEDELRQAITGPAQRFLRLVARNSEQPECLPDEVVFDPVVVDRLVADAQAIAHDPDHLPLLQHLLARLWEAALERENTDRLVPAAITKADLLRAVTAGRSGPAGGAGSPGAGDMPPPQIGDTLNVLRECVENWPQSVYDWCGPEQRAQIDAVLHHLAFKDPNTGLYSQQRMDVDNGARLLGEGKTRSDLRALFAEGFLGSVDYLFWDAEDPERVTLKVSHESFIRGWGHFRRVIDEQSRQFDEFLGVLRKSALWAAGGRLDDDLLQPGELRRLRDSGFNARWAQRECVDSWFRFVLLVRDGQQLVRLRPEVEAFVATSNQRLRDSLRRERRHRTWLGLSLLTLLLLPVAVFSVFIQGPVIDRAGMLFAAGNRANRAPLGADYPGVGEAGGTLESLLGAAELVDLARSGRSGRMAAVSQWLLQRFDWIAAVRSQDGFLQGVAAQAEPPVNGKLRLLMSSALWKSAGPEAAEGPPLPPPSVFDDRACLARDGDAGSSGRAARGRLFVAAGRDGLPQRAIFLPAAEGDEKAGIVLRSATVDPANGECHYGAIVLAIPTYLNPSLVFDAGLRYFIYSAYGDDVDIASATLHEIEWDRSESGAVRVLQSQVRSVVTSPLVVGALINAARPSRAVAVPTWRERAGRSVSVHGRHWRVISAAAQGLGPAALRDDFAPLLPSPEGSACLGLRAPWSRQSGARSEMRERQGGRHCFLITRLRVDTPAPGASGVARDEVLVAVYDRPPVLGAASAAGDEPAPVASLAPFARVRSDEADWLVGIRGEHAGWLALSRPSARGDVDRDGAQAARLIGVPWSTCALWRLGRQLLPLNSVAALAAANAAASAAAAASALSGSEPLASAPVMAPMAPMAAASAAASAPPASAQPVAAPAQPPPGVCVGE